MENRLLKSLHSTEKVYVRFINKTTTRDVDIIWYDFRGETVTYKTLKPDCHVDIDTFTNHPWCFEDSKTRDRLEVNKDYLFYPPSWADIFRKMFPIAEMAMPPHRIIVMITLPVYKLRERCLQVVRDNIVSPMNCEFVNELDLPKSVMDDLILMLLRKDKFYV